MSVLRCKRGIQRLAIMYKIIMRWISRFLPCLVLLLMSAICSCGSSKKAQNKVEVAKVEMSIKSADSMSVIKEYLITSIDSTTEDLEVTITEYDTTHPIDSVTKKPPVKKEIKASKKKNSHNATSREQKEKYETKSENARDLQAKDSVNAESVKEKTETTVPKQIGSVVWAVSALTGLIIILLIVFGVIMYKLKK